MKPVHSIFRKISERSSFMRYEEYKQRMGMEPTVYFYKLSGDPNGVTYYCDKQGIHLEEFDMNKVDYYSLPNIVSMMKTTRYSLIDEIMQTPFLTFERIFATK
jgi:hypothetical protein